MERDLSVEIGVYSVYVLRSHVTQKQLRLNGYDLDTITNQRKHSDNEDNKERAVEGAVFPAAVTSCFD